jgi:GBP family porin
MMRLRFVLLSIGLICSHAYAQSSVTLYGIIPSGIAYVSNEGGHSNVRAISGSQQGPRIGFRGSEDVGNGLSAIFELENGFNSQTGVLSQGGRLFGRQAYVGLSSVHWGAVTLGRQYDLVPIYLGAFESAVKWASFGDHIADNDNVWTTLRTDNSFRYTTPSYRGITFSGMYATSNMPGGPSDSNAYSFGVGYARGNLHLGAAFTQFNNPGSTSNPNGALPADNGDYGSIFTTSAVHATVGVHRQRVVGAGGSYQIGNAVASLLYTDNRYTYLDNSTLRLTNYEANIRYDLTPQWFVGAAYIYTQGKYDVVNNSPGWNQENLVTGYALSRRTDVFLVAIDQQAVGDADFTEIGTLPASSSRQQFCLELGFRHKF